MFKEFLHKLKEVDLTKSCMLLIVVVLFSA